MPSLTKHGKKRITERIGVSSGDAKRNAIKAYRHGILHSETSGTLHAWMDGRYLRHKTGSNMRIYRGFLYIFHDGVLITVFSIPQELQDSLSSYVDPCAYQKYMDYISKREAERAARNHARKTEKYKEKLSACS